MAKNNLWWRNRPWERYWLEATDRPDVGADLRAPAADAAGRSNWRYALFRETEIDDIVYHYDVQQRAIASWSRIAGMPEAQPIVWVARGSYARQRSAMAVEVPGYKVPLDTHSALRQPLGLSKLRDSAPQIAEILQSIPTTPGQPRYFPFELTERRPLRLLQGYAFKLPAAFVNAFAQLRDPEPPIAAVTTQWTDAEIALCIEVYGELLARQSAGEAINGSVATDLLVDRLQNRSKGAVIRRMQSISTVLERQGRPFLNRFAAREAVGTGVEARIAFLLDEMRPTSDPRELERRTRRARLRLREAMAPIPMGTTRVEWTHETVVRYRRRADVRAWVLNAAASTCEGCLEEAPFSTDEGEPYLEVHHVRPLSEGGPDTIDNTVAVCPTCHRRLHFSRERSGFRIEILRRISRLVDHPERAIHVSEHQDRPT